MAVMDLRWTRRGLGLTSLALTACLACAGDLASTGPEAEQGAPTCEEGAASASAVDLRGAGRRSLAELAALAVDGDEGERGEAIAALRGAGPAGLDAFIALHGPALAEVPPPPASSDAAGEGGIRGLLRRWPAAGEGSRGARNDARLDAAIDAICEQHGCRHTQLYWHTDLEAAMAEARASGRPILSLRLLGALGEPLSCANSRLFRTILYPALAPWLRARFVLHWSSERPAPVSTIDYGDGRQLTRTITGNSIHYVLDADGRPVDAIPGLVAPPVFQRLLERAAGLELEVRGQGEGVRQRRLADHHSQRLGELSVAWQAEMRAIGELPGRLPPRPGGARGGRTPRAADAMPLAISKMAVEMPMLGGLGIGGPTDDALWSRVADRHLGESELMPASLRAMGALEAITPAMREASARSLATDTVQNEHLHHRTIHQWFADGSAGAGTLDALNRRVYDSLFLTPRGDPTLGLAPPEVFSGLAGGGWSATR
ncbi:MAG: hypothetical protein R3A79_12620 [Nannocystaceae bacterium]